MKQYARTEFREDVWKQLARGIRFVQGDFDDDAAFDRLHAVVEELDRERGTMGNHAFYLSIPPVVPAVVAQLKRSGSPSSTTTSGAVVIEKPAPTCSPPAS